MGCLTLLAHGGVASINSKDNKVPTNIIILILASPRSGLNGFAF